MSNEPVPPRIKNVLSPRVIYERLCETVVGQEEAKKTISNAVFLHVIRLLLNVSSKKKVIKKSNVLLMGPTGSGKTMVVREASKIIQDMLNSKICPVLEVDCTEISARGWSGDDLSGMIKGHFHTVDRHTMNFNSTIVFLDEFDKLCVPATDKNGIDHNRNTQYNMLKLIEGMELGMGGSQGAATTENMLFILAGNFAHVRHAREKKKKATMGFNDTKVEDTNIDLHRELDEAGMISQLVGRTVYVAELPYLTEPLLKQILNEQLIPEYRDVWEFLDAKLLVSEEVKDVIVRDAFRRKTGARGLQADLGKHLSDELFNLGMEY